jgi:dienelactone hydrolase
MHPIDHGAGLLLRLLPSDRRVFRHGWGDERSLQHLDITAVEDATPLDVTWEREWTESDVTIRHGAYPSPFGGLPEAARVGFLLAIEPRGGSARSCIMLPSWNDEGFETRTRLARRLATRGIATLMPEAALYGRRRIAPRGSPITTVADFAMMSRSTVEEARSLVAALVAEGRIVGVAGYSMGGSLAAVVGATVDHHVALAPLAAAHAPAPVFTDGVLRTSVAWSALGEGGRARLAYELSQPSPLRRAPTPSTRTAVLLAASGDGFVPRAAAEALHLHWPGSEFRIVRAGHATLLWRGLDELTRAILDSFRRIGASGS